MARGWWEQARKVGEERWLVEHALPAPQLPGAKDDDRLNWPNAHILRVLRVKYPGRLSGLYRTMLRQRPNLHTENLANEIAASGLARAQTVALLEEGTAHEQMRQRLPALWALAELDRALFRKHLIAALGRHPGDAPVVVPLVETSEDPACWDALAAAARRATVAERINTLVDYRDMTSPPHAAPVRRERLRFLVRFLDDRSTAPNDPRVANWGEVRDMAAYELVGRRYFANSRGVTWCVGGLGTRGPLSRFILRESARQFAEQELERLTN